MFKFIKRMFGKGPASDRPSGGRQNPGAAEAMLILHHVRKTNQSLSNFLQALGSEFVYLITSTDGNFDNASTTEGSDGTTFIALFTSASKAEEVIASAGLPACPLAVSVLEIIYRLTPEMGVVLNPCQIAEWSFLPAQVQALRIMYAEAFPLAPGALHVMRDKGALYQVAKILATDDEGVHIRIYSNRWPSPPASADPATLSLSSAPDQAMGMGHLPFTRKAFLSMGPVFLQEGSVSEEELEGYHIWQKEKGGYFN